jgi:Matrixin
MGDPARYLPKHTLGAFVAARPSRMQGARIGRRLTENIGMRIVWLLLALALLGCAQDPVPASSFNATALDAHHLELFRQAAAYWSDGYRFGATSSNDVHIERVPTEGGVAIWNEGSDPHWTVEIDPDVSADDCMFYPVAIHEIGHTRNLGHSPDPTSFMHSPPPYTCPP